MFLSMAIAQAIHADRVREIERAVRDRRLLRGSPEPVVPVVPAAFVRPIPTLSQKPCAESANAPA